MQQPAVETYAPPRAAWSPTARLLVVGAGAVVLLAIVGLASRPDDASGDLLGSTLVIPAWVVNLLAGAIGAGLIIAWVVIVASVRGRRPNPPKTPWSLWSLFLQLLPLLVIAAGAAYLRRRNVGLPPQRPVGDPGAAAVATIVPPPASGIQMPSPDGSSALVAVLLALLAVVVFLLVTRRGKAVAAEEEELPDQLAGALEASIEDLEAGGDPRRAVIGAYSRMESLLGQQGIPRRKSEAPMEYLSRALGWLGQSHGSVERLTALFEWARFSPHDVDAGMRDEAIATLRAFQGELGAHRQAGVV